MLFVFVDFQKLDGEWITNVTGRWEKTEYLLKLVIWGLGVEVGIWNLESGNWKLETGDQRLETGDRKLETIDWKL